MAKVGYGRVSSVGQSLDVQREKLGSWAIATRSLEPLLVVRIKIFISLSGFTTW